MNEPNMSQPDLGHASDQPDINDIGDPAGPAHGEVAGSPPATGTGQRAPGASPTQPAATSGLDTNSDGQPENLIACEHAREYQARWDTVKARFVDEPRTAVRDVDALVGEVLTELQQLFARQRGDLERGLDDEQASTEDLRIALGRYRGFFDRLLTF